MTFVRFLFKTCWDTLYLRRYTFFIMAFLIAFFCNTAGTADLQRQLFALGIANKFSQFLLHISGCTRSLIHRSAFLGSLSIAHLFHRSVAFLHCFPCCLLFKGDLAKLLEILFAHLFLDRVECSDVSVVTFFNVFVSTLQDWVFG